MVCRGVTVTLSGKLHGVGWLLSLLISRTRDEVPETS